MTFGLIKRKSNDLLKQFFLPLTILKQYNIWLHSLYYKMDEAIDTDHWWQ